jgi:hypothetical protein
MFPTSAAENASLIIITTSSKIPCRLPFTNQPFNYELHLATAEANEIKLLVSRQRPHVILATHQKVSLLTKFHYFAKKRGKSDTKSFHSGCVVRVSQQPGMLPTNAIYLYLISRSLHLVGNPESSIVAVVKVG